MTIGVQRMRWWDIPEAVVLEDQLFPHDSPWTAAMFWSELAAGHHYIVYRQELAGPILGYAGLARGEDAEVQTIGVDPQAQGRGVGRALLADLIEHASGATRVLLEVRTDNVPAINLYQSMGFDTIGLRRQYYQPSGSDAYTMEKVL